MLGSEVGRITGLLKIGPIGLFCVILVKKTMITVED